MKSIGERIAQILDSPASTQEKQPAEKIKQQIIVFYFSVQYRFSDFLKLLIFLNLENSNHNSKAESSARKRIRLFNH